MSENSLIGLQFQASGSHGRQLDAAVLSPAPSHPMAIRVGKTINLMGPRYPTLRRLLPPDDAFLFADPAVLAIFLIQENLSDSDADSICNGPDQRPPYRAAPSASTRRYWKYGVCKQAWLAKACRRPPFWHPRVPKLHCEFEH